MHVLFGTLMSLLLVAGTALAADETKPRSPQAQRMADCSAEARDKKLSGDARKEFMSTCLRGPASREGAGKKADVTHRSKSADGGTPTQGERMKTCNQDATAKSLHGDERKQFMSLCLKADKKS